MDYQETDSGFTLKFRSFKEFVDRSEAPASTKKTRASRDEEDSDWEGTRTFEEAVALARGGYWEMAKEIRPNLLSEIERTRGFLTYKEEVTFEVEGHALDIARYVNGEPECVMRIGYQRGLGSYKEKVLTILVPFGYNWSVKSKTVRAYGLKIASLVQTMAMMGCQSQVTGYEYTSKDSDWNLTLVPIKPSDQALDLGRLCFAVGHPSMLRRLWFGVAETLPPKQVERFGFHSDGGYSKSAPLPEKPKWCDILIPHISESSGEDVKEWVGDRLREVGAIP